MHVLLPLLLLLLLLLAQSRRGLGLLVPLLGQQRRGHARGWIPSELQHQSSSGC